MVPNFTEMAQPVIRETFWDMEGLPLDDAADLLLSRMNQDEILAQLLMLSYNGDQPGKNVLDWNRQLGIAGIKIFGWNAEDLESLTKAIGLIQDASQNSRLGIPPFIATDQEGGWIRHIKGGTSITPGNMAIGASAWPSDAYYSALYIGRELAALGISMNFAPTVDLATKPKSTIVGPRAFSSDAMDTSILASAWVRGMADAGIAATAKHFPGHGGTELDSHGVLPVIDLDYEMIWDRELLPYRILASEKIPGIMSGHLAYPKITGDMMPASLSQPMLEGIIRKTIGYEGLIITDDLLMSGAYIAGGFPKICEQAIRAGNDIILFSKNLPLDDSSWQYLSTLYQNDAGFRRRVDESARRVLKAKLQWLLPKGRDGIYPVSDYRNLMQTAEAMAFFAEQAQRSVTGLGQNLGQPEGRVLLASQFSGFFTQALPFLDGYSWSTFRYSLVGQAESWADEMAAFSWQLRSCEAVLLCVSDRNGAALARMALAAGKKLYLVSVLNPFYILDFLPHAEITAVYSYSDESFRSALAVVFKRKEAYGAFPLGKN